MRLAAILVGRDRFSVISNDREWWSFLALKSCYGSFDDPTELRTRLDLLYIDFCNLSAFRVALDELGHARIRFHNSKNHVGLTRNGEVKLFGYFLQCRDFLG